MLDMESRTEQNPIVHNKYTNQFLFIIKDDSPFSSNELFLIGSYVIKWTKKHDDPYCLRLHRIRINENDKPDDKKFECLKLADSHSRITLVGHHKLNTDYFCHDKHTKIHYKDFIDIIRANVTSESVQLSPLEDIQYDQRALRITFLSCNIGVRTKKQSLAEKMFDYACNHETKPLRIEMTAPTMLCGPALFDKDEKLS